MSPDSSNPVPEEPTSFSKDIERLKRRCDREKRARKDAEQLLESKSLELFNINQELMQLTESLEEQVQNRTRELKQARDEALSSARAKGYFLANMSHEIRTPMNGILSVLQLLSDSPLTEQQQAWLKTAQHSGDLLLCVINDILDITKLEENKLQLEIRPFSTEELLHQCIASFTPQSEGKGIAVTYEVTGSVPEQLQGDSIRVQQILYNLVSNALKFTHEGSVDIKADYQNDQLILTVCDSGIGISEDQQAHIFRAFSQADESTTRKFGGTGLGLNICKRLAEMMSGNIAIESTQGEGSCFTVTLSLSAAELSNNEFEPLNTENGHYQKGDYKKYRNGFKRSSILITEDNDINQALISEFVRFFGCDIDIANNGQEAVDAVQMKNYDMVLMDIQMPVMDGLTATAIIRNLSKKYANLPIIAMTAHALSGDREKSLNAGMNDHITKPIDVDHLFQVFTHYLGSPDEIPDESPIASDEACHRPESPAISTQDTNTTDSPENELESIPTFEHLDLTQAIKRVNDNWPALRTILFRFAKTHLQDEDKIRKALAESDTETARITAHTLKGSSGGIGAEKVYELSAEVETLIKQNDLEKAINALPNLASAIQCLCSEITEFQDQFETQLSQLKTEQTPSTQANNLSHEDVQQYIDNVQALAQKTLSVLNDDLGQTQTFLTQLTEALSQSSRFLPDNVLAENVARLDPELNEAFQIFDFDSLHEKLSKLTSSSFWSVA